MNSVRFFIFFVSFAHCASVLAHETQNAQLRRLDAAIAASPESGALYLRHASLLTQIGDASQALDVLERGGTHAAQDPHYKLVLGQALLAGGRGESAVAALSEYCAANPTSHPGGLALARALRGTDKFNASATVFTGLISDAAHPSPDLYIEAAAVLDAADRAADAVALLSRGIDRLGAVATLQLALIDRHVAAMQQDAALALLDDMIAASGRHDLYLLMKAEILLSVGRREDACAVGRRGIAAIDALPVRIQHAENTRATRASLIAVLEGVES